GVCLDARVAATGADGAHTLHQAFTAWARHVPQAALGQDGDDLTLHACDPGEAAAQDVPDRAETSLALPVARLQVWADELDGDAGRDAARCAADAFGSGLTTADLARTGPLPDNRLRDLRTAVSRGCDR